MNRPNSLIQSQDCASLARNTQDVSPVSRVHAMFAISDFSNELLIPQPHQTKETCATNAQIPALDVRPVLMTISAYHVTKRQDLSNI